MHLKLLNDFEALKQSNILPLAMSKSPIKHVYANTNVEIAEVEWFVYIYTLTDHQLQF